MATYSFEVDAADRDSAPPFTDRCPRCPEPVRVVPYATTTEGDNLTAFYRHRPCGHQWSCQWDARWSPAWRR
jgi:hypothetical protein